MNKRQITSTKLPPIPKIENKYTQVIRVAGDLNRAKTADGKEVVRQDYLYFPEWSPYRIRCCPYSVHFIFDDPVKEVGHWTPMCTCGGAAGVVGANIYTKLMSPTVTGEMIVCLTHMATFINTGHGFHADGTSE